MARRLEVVITGSSKDLERAFGRSAGAASGFGRSMARLGTIAGAAVGAGFGIAVNQAVAFDRGMRNVNSIAKLSEGHLKTLSKEVLKLAGPTGQAPKVLTRGLYDIVSSGFKAKDAIRILAVSAKAATAGMTDTATSTKAVTAALNAYHLGAGQARKVSDILFTTVNKGVLTFEELAQNMGDLVPAAAPLGISLEEVGAGMSTLTLQGVPAAEAATRMKNTMLQLASPSKALSGLLREQGFESGEAAIKAKGFSGVLQLLQQATGGSVTETAKLTPEIRALLGAVGLTGENLATYNQHLQAHQDASKGAGAAAEAFAEQSKSVGAQWDKVKASLSVLAIEIGSKLLPAMSSVLSWVQANWPQIAAIIDQASSRISSVVKTSFEGIVSIGRPVVAFLRTDLGQSMAAGLVGALAFAKGMAMITTAVSAAKVAIMAFSANPIVLAMSVIGAVIGSRLIPALLSSSANFQSFEGAARAAKGAIDALKFSMDNLKQAHLNVESAQLRLFEASARVTSAQSFYNASVAEHGRKAPQSIQAYRDLRQAIVDKKQALLDSKRAVDDEGTATTKRAQELAAPINAVKKFSESYSGLATALKNTNKPGQDFNERMTTSLAHMTKADKVDVYTRAMHNFAVKNIEAAAALQKTDPAAAAAARKTGEFALEVVGLTQKLGRMPTKKEFNFILKHGVPAFLKDLDKLEPESAKAGAGATSGLQKGMAPMGERANAATRKVPGIVRGFSGATRSGGFATGSAGGQGVAEGIMSQIPAIRSAAAQAAAASVISMQQVLRTGSRSKETYEKAGIPAGQGLIEGITEYLKANGTKVGEAAKKATDIAAQVLPSIQAAGRVLGLAKAQAIAAGIVQGAPSLAQQMKTALSQAVTEALAAAATKVREAKDAFSSAFSELSSAALAAFDAQVAKWKSPSQKLLEKMQLQDQIKQLKDSITAGKAGIETAQAGLTEALGGGDPAAIATAQAAVLAAQETFNQAVRAKREFELGQAAQKETEAHTKAMERRRVQFENQLTQAQNWLARHPEEYAKGQRRILAVLDKFVPDFKLSGQALGFAMARGLEAALDEVEKAAAKLARAAAKYLKLKSPAEEGELADLDSWWSGLASTLVSGLDLSPIRGVGSSIASALRAGIDEPLSAGNPLEKFGASLNTSFANLKTTFSGLEEAVRPATATLAVFAEPMATLAGASTTAAEGVNTATTKIAKLPPLLTLVGEAATLLQPTLDEKLAKPINKIAGEADQARDQIDGMRAALNALNGTSAHTYLTNHITNIVDNVASNPLPPPTAPPSPGGPPGGRLYGSDMAGATQQPVKIDVTLELDGQVLGRVAHEQLLEIGKRGPLFSRSIGVST